MMVKNNLVYLLDSKIYVNLTNLCTNDCKFCIRGLKDDVVGAHMWLETENITAQDVIAQLKNFEDKIHSGVTFCGYGEPTIKIDVLKELKEKGYNTSRLRKEKIMGEATIQKIREKQLASWATIDTICTLLDCNIGDVIEYRKEV